MVHDGVGAGVRPRAQCLGYAFERGEGVPAADAGEAVRLSTLGTARGEMHGLASLGHAHATGLGPLAASLPAALGFFERAARQGFGNAQYNAALSLFHDVGGVARDDKMAYFWMVLSFRGFYANAKTTLPDYEARCTGDCRTEAEALASAFAVEDACTASRYTRESHCSGRGTPTPQ